MKKRYLKHKGNPTPGFKGTPGHNKKGSKRPGPTFHQEAYDNWFSGMTTRQNAKAVGVSVCTIHRWKTQEDWAGRDKEIQAAAAERDLEQKADILSQVTKGTLNNCLRASAIATEAMRTFFGEDGKPVINPDTKLMPGTIKQVHEVLGMNDRALSMVRLINGLHQNHTKNEVEEASWEDIIEAVDDEEA